MEKKHIITISGKPGSGKSSTADKVAELLSYTRYSAGDMVRTRIQKQGITLGRFNEMALQDHKIDHEIDEELRKLRDQKNIVIDSRLGFYWIPESFKVYLDLDMQVATERIYKDSLHNTLREHGSGTDYSIQDAQQLITSRIENEKQRFKALYGINPYNNAIFDLIINTSDHSPDTVALTVLATYKKWLQSDGWSQVVSEASVTDNSENS